MNHKIRELLGQRFGRLAVIGRAPRPTHVRTKSIFWRCQCDCGQIANVAAHCLTSGNTSSCGCLRIERLRSRLSRDLAGRTFGRVTALRRADASCGKRYWFSHWICRCSCGREIVTHGSNLASGATKSCGCLRTENALIAVRSRAPVGEAGFRTLFKTYARMAKKRSLDFLLSMDRFRELTTRSCFYCGVEPRSIKGVSAHAAYLYNGIDRYDSAVGYTNDNCVTCCGQCNYAKAEHSAEEFLAWAHRLVAFQGQSQTQATADGDLRK